MEEGGTRVREGDMKTKTSERIFEDTIGQEDVGRGPGPRKEYR